MGISLLIIVIAVLIFLIYRYIKNQQKKPTNVIPYVIFTTQKPQWKDLPQPFRTSFNQIKERNPHLTLQYYSDNDVDEYMRNTPYYNDWSSLKTGAAKADLFRLVKIVDEGGIWFDSDIYPPFYIDPKYFEEEMSAFKKRAVTFALKLVLFKNIPRVLKIFTK